MSIDPYTVAQTLLDADAVLLRPDDPFTFASGLLSPVYCDNRLLLGNVAARRTITAAFAPRCDDAEVLAGPATGGIPWAAWVAEQLALPMAYVRGSAKGHGRGQQIEGAAVAGRRVVLLEDTISTGESALVAAEALRDSGAEVIRCGCIFTWGWSATATRFETANVPLHPLATLPDLLDVAATAGQLSAAHRTLIESWANDPQGWQTNH
ncbi:MAG: orotate phosphoribosyltransferase [Chloroflexi bacterium AL-W]|nr:orotate phosphoribosyltransferase [Chloroflexi bacterium AL-N1]NOK65019.1 orotate phosphoribosyltransferase [Chloroflexi bacterium AL-N10]NOK76789.1 orotate phosphoribosyltransferase [Chloroflexi bacterium AL-N5]NOK84681.1 orotate phosphoribosyltransferase [Chloroflexi bacterium AL-W]NOK86494.1 orotate phosphoribosyltransferase [Chloroflexi bacterium AL-N15]